MIDGDNILTCALAPASLQVEEATVSYRDRPVLQQVTFCVPAGSTVAVIGPNGAGKSTLFKALMGLLPLQSGSISIHGLPLGHHKDCVAYMPQREEVDWRFPVSVFDVVMTGRYGQLGWCRRPGKKDRTVVTDCLDKLGIADLAAQPIGSLSGGQQQRVFLARALAQEPHIILMDEPFTGVDASTQETVLALLDDLREQQVTILTSTHDLNLATRHFDQVLLLNRRLIAFGSARRALTAEAVAEAFGEQVGNVLGVSMGDLWLTGCVGLAVLIVIALLYKELLVVAFDPILAATLRLPTELLRTLMLILILIALAIVVSMQTVGVGLVAAMLVTPAATALLLARRLPAMMVISAVVGAVFAVIGLYLSFYINIASGAAVVLVATTFFILVFLFAPHKGVLWRHMRKMRAPIKG